MKRRRSAFSFLGAFMFFVLIAFVIQIAVLVYDYIIQRTDNKGLIAILILIVILILSVICTVIDIVRRKLMVDKPVTQILEATEKIAKGDFSVRVVPSHNYERYNEYDVIMENINTMAQELSKSEILKTDFISNVSHEIKTPLAIIQNYASMLQGEDLSDADKRECASRLSSASKRLSQLITNILKLNKLENQEIKPDIQEFNLSDQLAQAILEFEELFENKGLELRCEIDDIRAISSPSYLEIIWNNLISNAIKFTDTGGEVCISLSKDGSNAVLKISDTGCGISPEAGKRIFEKFYQADTSHQGKGNGLGLALVKKVIDVLGGEISVESELNKGSTFTVTLKDIVI